MYQSVSLKTILLFLFIISFVVEARPCSMYKITVNGKTMVGNNEDSWGRDSRIWFEQGNDKKFGAVYVGYRRKDGPDGAMNECGLAFDAFTMPHKANMPEKDTNKKDFNYSHVKTVMQECKTVDEVYSFFEKLNLHVLNGSVIFNGGMLLFVDKSGKYLVVEADKMTFGNDDKFVLANFSFADTKDLSTIKVERYCKGVHFLENKKTESNLSFCTSLSDTMSVNRKKIGDGTLYTNIYDLEEGIIHTYFFHDYTKRISFNLKEELAKGDHSLNFDELFPNNKNYERFLHYKTPQNNKPIFIFIILCGILFFVSSVYFLFSFFKSSNTDFKYLKIGISVLSFAMFMYMIILLRNQTIFYFPSPYHHQHSVLVTISSYLPFLLIILISPLFVYLIKIIQQKCWTGWARGLLISNHLAYMILIGLFVYWKMFGI